MMTRHYRITRPGGYSLHTPGHKSLGARQGYYVDAASPIEACRKLVERCPSFKGETFDVQVWDNDKAKEVDVFKNVTPASYES